MVDPLQRRRAPDTVKPQHADLRAGRQPPQHLRFRPRTDGPRHPLLRRIPRGRETGLHQLGAEREANTDAETTEGRDRGRAPRHEDRRQGGCRCRSHVAGRPTILQCPAQDAAGRKGEHQRRGAVPRHARHFRRDAGHRYARHGRARRYPRQALAAQPDQLYSRRLRLWQG